MITIPTLKFVLLLTSKSGTGFHINIPSWQDKNSYDKSDESHVAPMDTGTSPCITGMLSGHVGYVCLIFSPHVNHSQNSPVLQKIIPRIPEMRLIGIPATSGCVLTSCLSSLCWWNLLCGFCVCVYIYIYIHLIITVTVDGLEHSLTCAVTMITTKLYMNLSNFLDKTRT